MSAPQERAQLSPAIEALGWIGMISITAAYVLNARGVLPDGALYQGLNAGGALALLVLCRAKRDWPTFALECVWLAVSLVGIGRSLF